jgi:uncharacterized protein YdhG (YjbR/CyaY superfamily)
MAAAKPKKDPEAEVLEKIAAMTDADRAIAEPLHALIRESAPELTPKLWYGQPAYAKGGKVIVFFRGADVDGERYLTLGFSGNAQLDDGNLWPTAYAVTGLTAEDEARIAELVRTAAG